MACCILLVKFFIWHATNNSKDQAAHVHTLSTNHPHACHMPWAQFYCCRSLSNGKSTQLSTYATVCMYVRVWSRCHNQHASTNCRTSCAHTAVDRMFSWLLGLCKLTAKAWPVLWWRWCPCCRNRPYRSVDSFDTFFRLDPHTCRTLLHTLTHLNRRSGNCKGMFYAIKQSAKKQICTNASRKRRKKLYVHPVRPQKQGISFLAAAGRVRKINKVLLKKFSGMFCMLPTHFNNFSPTNSIMNAIERSWHWHWQCEFGR